MAKIITISGKAESGKDTSAQMLKEQLEDLGYNVLICHYADLLKFICKNFFDWDGQKNEEGRTLLQRVGTEGVRKYNPNYWVEFILEILAFFPDEWDFVLIPDARFPNEINLLKDDNYDVMAVKVVRTDYENHLTEEQRNHPSETALDDYIFDYTLLNESTKEGLYANIKSLVSTIIEKR